MAAQAARLSLRMQKELKLLIAGPPPGACFPRLSSDSEHLSLSSIQAQIKGPEGTVYEKGVFELNIQIPDRYPFQPPIVTFSTPIYHPNIDTGGRICLDILNLPPKGAWQPSLNISTVLTSIGLLLTEPNPDDGLMCEASREYKYNKQAFDQKARSMTEKYAHPGATRNTGVSRCTQSSSIPSTTEGKPTENESKPEPSQSMLGCNDVRGTGRKLTLKSSRPSLESDDDSVNQKETERAHKELKHTAETSNQSRENLNANRRKLSLEAPLSRKRNDDEKENVASLGLLMQTGSDCPGKDLGLSQENISVDDSVNTKRKKMSGTYPNRPFGSFERIDVTEEKMLANPQLSPFKTNTSTVPDRSCFEPHLQERSTDGIEYVSSGTSRDKLSLGGKKLSLGLKGSSRTKSRENVEPVLKSQSSSMCLSVEVPSGNGDGKLTKLKASDNNHIQKLASYRNLSEPSKSTPRQHELGSDQDRNETIIGRVGEQEAEESAMAESVIVLDSEDSEEEDKIVSSRSKPVLARKRLGKWKLGA